MNILNKILATKKAEVAELRQRFTLKAFEDLHFFNALSISFKGTLENSSDINIIAEVKKASPSKGIIRQNFEHQSIAWKYMHAGADAVSVLTDTKYFQGSINYLKDIAQIKSVPLLRKDFIIDEYQVYQAKAYGADFILLIAEALSESQIKDLTYAANEIGLEVLLEIHSENQLKKIDLDFNDIIGINNRDLSTFCVDLNTSVKIAEMLPRHVKVIAESGFTNKASIEKIKDSKIDGILVGEHFMRSDKIEDEISKFKKWCRR
jgi:indole-3-glycerol phosphate synthase